MTGAARGKSTGKVTCPGRRVDEITKPDIDLHDDPCSLQTRWHAQPDAFVFGVFLDSGSFDAGEIEENPVGLDQRADFTNTLRNVGNRRGSISKQVEITRRTMHLSLPREK